MGFIRPDTHVSTRYPSWPPGSDVCGPSPSEARLHGYYFDTILVTSQTDVACSFGWGDNVLEQHRAAIKRIWRECSGPLCRMKPPHRWQERTGCIAALRTVHPSHKCIVVLH